MKRESEPFSEDSRYLRLVENAIQGVRPDVAELEAWHISYVEDHKTRIAFDLRLIDSHVPKTAKILEFGSVPLMLTAALARIGFSVTGIDLSPDRYSSAINDQELIILSCDIERDRLPLEADSFDAAVFFELFEHLRINPIFTLREVYRVLKPGGTLLLSSPNLKSAVGIANFLFRSRAYSCSGDVFTEYSRLDEIGHMGHVREYTATEVTEFLGRVGFSTESVIFRGKFSSKKWPFLAVLANIVIRLFPSLRPFITYQLRKPS